MAVKSPSNIKVLDLSNCISGPYCTRLLAGWGAEVVKIERPGHGDVARNAGPFPEGQPHLEASAPFLYLNTSKKSVTLNLNSVTGAGLLKQLVEKTDVLVENYETGEMAKLGLDYKILEKINPRLVMTSISAFGQTGPYRNYKASSMVSYAIGGQMYVCGQADREPLNAGASISEYLGGLYGFIGTMMALQYRKQTGEGQLVDISIMECLAASHQFTLTWPEYSGAILERPGWPGSHAPKTFYRCKDGFITLRLQGIELGLLAQLFAMPELLEDPRFTTLDARSKHFKELEAIVSEKIARLNKKDVFRTAGEWRALCGYVATPQDLLNDPQYKSRNFWVELGHPYAGKQTYPGAPVQMTATGWTNERAPLLGEHNEEIYCRRLGYTKEKLVKLKKSGVI